MPSGGGFDGLVRACKYSFSTNRLDYCGEHGAFTEFQSFLDGPDEGKAVKIRALFHSFTGLYAYLELIASCNARDPLDADVVEAYWLGNNLLDNVPAENVREMLLQRLSGPGLLPRRIAEEKASVLSGKVFPHHSFHVLHVNFVTEKVAPLLGNLDNCIIHWGRVKEAEENCLLVEGVELFEGERVLALRPAEKRIDRGLAKDALPGDAVSIHWNSAVERISPKQEGMLRRYTEENLALANSVRSGFPPRP
ncbi:MAG: DUF6390 family protein [Candidatus Micrarchaeota archaeon]